MTTIRTEAEFEAAAASPGGAYILFHSPYCPFCTAFLPVFEKAAPAGSAAVSTDDLPELEEKFGIEVVPSVLFFRGGRLEKRLDGALGRGLSEEGLRAFAPGAGTGQGGER